MSFAPLMEARQRRRLPAARSRGTSPPCISPACGTRTRVTTTSVPHRAPRTPHLQPRRRNRLLASREW